MGLSTGTLSNWHSQYGGLEENAARRLLEVVTPARKTPIVARVPARAPAYRRASSLFFHGRFKAEGLVTNKKHTFRLAREANRPVRPQRRKTVERPQAPLRSQTVPISAGPWMVCLLTSPTGSAHVVDDLLDTE